MIKKMLVNVSHAEESRVAIVEDGILQELGIEVSGRGQVKGNIYKGVVTNVEQGLQAAFVDYGGKRSGFLPLSDVQPQHDANGGMGGKREKGSSHTPLRRHQELVVQVVKDEVGSKGVALTTYISLPGRYLVLMPGSDSKGISRKIEDESDRNKLRKIMEQVEPPAGMGFIVRTAGYNRTKSELSRDLSYLLKLWENISLLAQQLPAPSMVYQEQDLVIRTIRDYFSTDIQEVLIDHKEVCRRAKEFFQSIMPRYEKVVKLHQEKRPLFSKFQIEEQIESFYGTEIPLKSGGSIVIEPTEALVSIDVNSGRSTQEKGMEETAYKTNLEAAEEIARQLRLRDLGGLIVLDFIDMKDRKHLHEVEKCLKNALKRDKARIQLSRISRFGLLEMSRQRIKTALHESYHQVCPHCEGKGVVKTVEAAALSALRKIQTKMARGDLASIRATLPSEVAFYLLNQKRDDLLRMEKEGNLIVSIQEQAGAPVNHVHLECDKKALLAPPREISAEIQEGVSAPAPEEVPQEAPVFPPRIQSEQRQEVSYGGQVQETPPAEDIGETTPSPPSPGAEGNVVGNGAAILSKSAQRRRRFRPRRKKAIPPKEEGRLEG